MKTELLRIYTEERKEVCIRRLKAAEGQLRGVQEMIEAQRPCLEVLTQSDPKVYDELMDAIFKFSQ